MLFRPYLRQRVRCRQKPQLVVRAFRVRRGILLSLCHARRVIIHQWPQPKHSRSMFLTSFTFAKKRVRQDIVLSIVRISHHSNPGEVHSVAVQTKQFSSSVCFDSKCAGLSGKGSITCSIGFSIKCSKGFPCPAKLNRIEKKISESSRLDFLCLLLLPNPKPLSSHHVFWRAACEERLWKKLDAS